MTKNDTLKVDSIETKKESMAEEMVIPDVVELKKTSSIKRKAV